MQQKKRYDSFVSMLKYGISISFVLLGLFVVFNPLYVIAEFVRLSLAFATIIVILLILRFNWGYKHDVLGRPRVRGSLAPRKVDFMVKIFLILATLVFGWFLWDHVYYPIALQVAIFLKSIGVPMTEFAFIALIGNIILEYYKK